MTSKTDSGPTNLRPARLELSPDALLTTTRTVRKRLDLETPVERAVVEECLELAFHTPNADNLQLWDWVVVDDSELRAKVAEVYQAAMCDVVEWVAAYAQGGPAPEVVRLGVEAEFTSPAGLRMLESVLHLSEHLHEVPVLVIPTLRCRMEDATVVEQASMWGSILPAVWSFMLALRSRGMGSAWTTAHIFRERDMATVLGIPYGEVTQAGLFPVAYTLGTDFKRADRAASRSSIHWNTW